MQVHFDPNNQQRPVEMAYPQNGPLVEAPHQFSPPPQKDTKKVFRATISDLVRKYSDKLPAESVATWRFRMKLTESLRLGFDIWFYAYLTYFFFAPKRKWFHLTMNQRTSFLRLVTLGFLPTSILGLMRLQSNVAFLKENKMVLVQNLNPEELKYFDLGNL